MTLLLVAESIFYDHEFYYLTRILMVLEAAFATSFHKIALIRKAAEGRNHRNK
jgi:hypothetical protein